MRTLGILCMIALSAVFGHATPTPAEQSFSSELLGKFQSEWPVGDPRRCIDLSKTSNLKVKRFEVLPGLGWDNLRNREAGVVVNYNYSLCKLTDDGNLLIPDNVFTVPIKSSSVQSYAELIDQWHNSSSTTANTVNVEAGLALTHFSISGKFSYEHDELKSKQIEDKAVTTRVQLRYYRYEAKLQPDTEMSPQFKERLLSIAANVELNRTEQARYEGQLLVRDFGTHVLTSVTAGAGLLKDDYLRRDWVSSSTEYKTQILASASASFFNIFKMSASYGHSQDQKFTDSYNKQMTHSFIKTIGGPIFQAENMTMNQWSQGVDNNLVAMDRSGDPLYFLVTPQNLPELPTTTVSEVEKIVRQSIELYYEMNVIPGCTKLGSPNFSFSANFDDGSCHSKPTNLTFGGVYQQCQVAGRYLSRNPCDGLEEVNPKTGDFSCPASYTPVKLRLGTRNSQTENQRSCHSCWLFFHCCHTDQYYSEAVYTTYWCAATGPVQKDSGYLFGGIYTKSTDNLVTGTKGCPPTYYPRHMVSDMSLCISDDYEFGSAYSAPFGGFYSCESGNPLSAEGVRPVGSKMSLRAPPPNSLKSFMAANGGNNNWPSRCPDGYSQHLATDDMGCSIYYCVQTGALSAPNLPPIKRPPFMTKPPTIIDNKNNLIMFDLQAHTWKKDQKAVDYQKTLAASRNGPGHYSMSNNDQQEADAMSPAMAAGITFAVTIACVAIATGIIIAVNKRRAKRRGMYRRLTSEESHEPVANYGSVEPETVVAGRA